MAKPANAEEYRQKIIVEKKRLEAEKKGIGPSKSIPTSKATRPRQVLTSIQQVTIHALFAVATGRLVDKYRDSAKDRDRYLSYLGNLNGQLKDMERCMSAFPRIERALYAAQKCLECLEITDDGLAPTDEARYEKYYAEAFNPKYLVNGGGQPVVNLAPFVPAVAAYRYILERGCDELAAVILDGMIEALDENLHAVSLGVEARILAHMRELEERHVSGLTKKVFADPSLAGRTDWVVQG